MILQKPGPPSSSWLRRNALVLYTLIFCLIYFSFHSPLYSQTYFQQEVNYTIHVKLDDVKNELNASERIEYLNNSPDVLHEIYFHLWPNAYKDENTAMAKQLLENGETSFYYSKPEERGFMDSLNFKVNDTRVDLILDKENGDIGKLLLKTPLQPGEKITITTPFHVKIPNADFSRLGHLNQAYMISQWFPKPAVYDVSGWHSMPYLTQGEFYSEFGSFEVSITLPKNYVVGATGYLQDSSEINWLNENAKATTAIVSFDNSDLSFPDSDTAYKTIHYKASKVHDFAWFADKRFHVLTDEIELPVSKRKVTSWTMFTNSEAQSWKHGPEYIRQTLLSYSEWLGEYPYDQVTIIDGTVAAGIGMEYPMVTAIGASAIPFDLEYTVAHEVGHNWFYGILGSNERNHAWMDEGMNTYYNLRLFDTKYHRKNFAELYYSERLLRFAQLKKYTHKTQYVLSYLITARENLDQRCNEAAVDFTYLNYGNDVYFKTGFIFHYLSSYLGQEVFDSIMKMYYEAWKFKHPQPNDLRKVFTENSPKNLDWFFNDLLSTTKKLDYKISSLSKQDSLYVLKIKNKAAIAGPFSISAIKNNQVVKTKWFDGALSSQKVNFPRGDYSFLEIDYPWDSPEINRRNNVIRTNGIFKKVEPFHFQFIGSVENSEKTTINYFPVVGFNNYDKLMAGLAFYNISVIQKRLEYLILPMYAFGSKELNGAVHLKYHWNPDGFIQAIEPQLSIKKYSYRDVPFALGFLKFSPALEFTLKKKYARSPVIQKVKISNAVIWEDEAIYAPAEKEYQKKNYSNLYYINSLIYSFRNNRTLNPFQFSILVEQGKDYAKSSLEATYHFSYKRRNKSADVRVFGGKFLYEHNASALFGFAMSGNNDYAYDNIYLGRNDAQGVFNQQVYIKDAGFKNLTLTPNSMDWMLATSIFVPAPGKIPLAFYADLGKAATSVTLDYDWGVALVLLRNVFEVYAPIQQSSDLNQLKYSEKIRFVLHLNALNPFEQIKNSFH